jgi:hypothetical protein
MPHRKIQKTKKEDNVNAMIKNFNLSIATGMGFMATSNPGLEGIYFRCYLITLRQEREY